MLLFGMEDLLESCGAKIPWWPGEASAPLCGVGSAQKNIVWGTVCGWYEYGYGT